MKGWAGGGGAGFGGGVRPGGLCPGAARRGPGDPGYVGFSGGGQGRRGVGGRQRPGALRPKRQRPPAHGLHHQDPHRPSGFGAAGPPGGICRGGGGGGGGLRPGAGAGGPGQPVGAGLRDAAGFRQRRRQRRGGAHRRQPGGVRPADEPAGGGAGPGGQPFCHPLRPGRPGALCLRLRPGAAGPGGAGKPPLRPDLRQRLPGSPLRGPAKAPPAGQPQPAAKGIPGDGGGQDRLHEKGRPLPGERRGAGGGHPHRRDAGLPGRLERPPGALRPVFCPLGRHPHRGAAAPAGPAGGGRDAGPGAGAVRGPRGGGALGGGRCPGWSGSCRPLCGRRCRRGSCWGG